MPYSQWILLLLLEGMCVLSTHSFSTHPTSQGNPPRAVLAAATEEPTADLAYKCLLSDLKSLPTRRASKWGSTTSNNVKNYSEGLMQSLETCPALKDLYYLNEDSSSYCKELIQVVGPISRYQLMDMIVKHPQLMVKALTSENLRSTHVQIQQDLNLPPQEIKRFLQKAAPNLKKVYRKELRSILHQFDTLGMDRITQQKVLMTMPRLINYSNAKLEHSISFFQTDLCMTNSEVIQMIRQHPNILTHSINGKLKPLTQYFVDFGIAPSRWKKMLVRYPKITTVPIGKLGTRAKFLESALGLKGQLDISYVITGFPPTLWLGEENIMNKVYVLCRELELEEDDLRNIMVTYPNILGYSIENNILPKFQFLLGDFKPNSGTDVAMDQAMMGETCIGAGMTRQELKEFVLYQPSLLGYSLENRIRPRIAQMQQLSIRFPYAPLYLMSLTDVKFRKWLDTQTSTWSIS